MHPPPTCCSAQRTGSSPENRSPPWFTRWFLFIGCNGKEWFNDWKTWEWLVSKQLRCPPYSTNLRLLEITSQALPHYISICTHVHTHIFVCAIQLVLIICRFPICKFAYVLKFLCNPQINTHSNFTVIHGHMLSGDKVSQLRSTKVTLSSCFSSQSVNKCPVCNLFWLREILSLCRRFSIGRLTSIAQIHDTI